MEFGKTEPSGLADRSEIDFPAHACHEVSDDYAEQNRQAAHKATEADCEQKDGRDRGDGRDGRLFDVVPCTGGEVEADERDDGPRDHRRHEPVYPAGACKMHDEADGGECQARGYDAALGESHLVGVDRHPGFRAVARHGGDGRNECEGRTEIARQLPARDEEEEDRADAGEEKRGRGVEACEDGDEEGCAEHGDDVLGADADGARPREPFFGRNHLPRLDRAAISVQFPP